MKMGMYFLMLLAGYIAVIAHSFGYPLFAGLMGANVLCMAVDSICTAIKEAGKS